MSGGGGARGQKGGGNIGDLLIGGTASTKDLKGQGSKSTVIPGIGTIMNQNLQEHGSTKKAPKKYVT